MSPVEAIARPAAAARCRRQTYVCKRSIAGSSNPATSSASSAPSSDSASSVRNIADCQDASRDWVCPSLRANADSIAGSTNPSSSSATISRAASTSPSVNATSSSGTVAKPTACQIRSARSIEIPARRATSLRVNFRSPPSSASSNLRCSSARSAGGWSASATSVRDGLVDRAAEPWDPAGQPLEAVLGEVQQLHPRPRGDRCRTQRVLPDRDLADDLTGPELGDLLALDPHRGRAAQDQVRRVGGGQLHDQRPPGRYRDLLPRPEDLLDLPTGEVCEQRQVAR